MGETVNKSQIATKLFKDILRNFYWDRHPLGDQSWECVDPSHMQKGGEKQKEDHPSDVVFSYEDPYFDRKIYVNTDLKSYGSATISKSKMTNSINNLIMAISCASKSEGWQKLYAPLSGDYEVWGMLFVYNHDGGYAKDFLEELAKINFNTDGLPPGKRLFVVGPESIQWMYKVSMDLTILRSPDEDNRIPDRDFCSYFYPQAIQRPCTRKLLCRAATIDLLLGPLLVLQCYESNKTRISQYIIFIKGKEKTAEEFIYILDYLRISEIIGGGIPARVRCEVDDGTTVVNFHKARQEYMQNFLGALQDDSALVLDLKGLSIEDMNHNVPQFSDKQIGMDYD